MSKELVDKTAGKRDWWDGQESSYMLDTLLGLDDAKLERMCQEVCCEPAKFHRCYTAVRIRSKLRESMDFADALDFVQGFGDA